MNKITIAFLAAVSLASFGCKKKGGAGEAMAKMGEFKDQMCACKDKACADKVQEGMNKWSADNAKSAGDKPEKPSDEDMKKMQDVGTKYGECMAKAMGGGDMATPPAGDTASGSAGAPPAGGSGDGAMNGGTQPASGELPAECKDYQAAIEKLSKCDKLPQATRDALKQSYEQTSAAWASVPAEGRAALGTACKSAADAVNQSAAACN
ncbi:hypothetical protein BH11MYX3_BH11MYX3_10600 [soil metagenome]